MVIYVYYTIELIFIGQKVVIYFLYQHFFDIYSGCSTCYPTPVLYYSTSQAFLSLYSLVDCILLTTTSYTLFSLAFNTNKVLQQSFLGFLTPHYPKAEFYGLTLKMSGCSLTVRWKISRMHCCREKLQTLLISRAV